MANVIKSLLVGIGFDWDKESSNKVDSEFSAIISKGKALGAVLAGAFGIGSLKTLASEFADAKAKMGRFQDTFSVQANDVQALGTAFEASGGSVEKLQGQLENLISKRDNLLKGDVSWFPDAFKAGFNVDSFTAARNGIDAYLNVAEQLKNMSPEGRRLTADALGIDKDSIQFLMQGRGALEAQMAKFSRIRPITQDMINDAKEYNKAWVELAANAGRFGDVVGQNMAVGASAFFKYMNNYMDKNRGNLGGALVDDWVRGVEHLASDRDGSIYNNSFTRAAGGEIEQIAEDALNNFQLSMPSLFGSAPQQQSQVYRGRVERAPQPAQPIEVNLVLDGKVIDKRIITIQERAAQDAISEITSSEGD